MIINPTNPLAFILILAWFGDGWAMRQIQNQPAQSISMSSSWEADADTPKVQRLLYEKYSSSQTYFYTNKINEIVREKRTAVNILYEDVEYLLDLEENLKRWYHMRQYDNKMFTFKEYYFYHQDCPRIFLKGIEEPYAKWQDKKRDLVYKRLKIAYNESDSSSEDSRQDDQKSQNYVALTHFLLEISEYNPYSKKYYLRAEARRDKEKKKAEEERRHQSKRDLESLKNDLSAMLNDMSQLSDISTLSMATPKVPEKYKSIKLGSIPMKKSQQRSGNSRSHLSNSNSLIKFNFKKNKDSSEKAKNVKEAQKISIKKQTIEPEARQDSKQEERRLSPKYNSNNIHNDLIKSKSIFSVSSFGALRSTDIKQPHKRQQLKLNFETKKLVLEDAQKKYQTEKKKDSSNPKNLIITSKSSSKFEARNSLEKLRSKQTSVGKPKPDEFSDKKLNDANAQFRMRSLKSEYLSSSKKALLSIKPTLEQKGKRLLQIKNW